MRRSSLLIIILLLVLCGCSQFGQIRMVGVLGKADTDEAVIVFTDVNGNEQSRKIEYPAEEYFGEEAVYYSADKINYDSIGFSDLKKRDRIENVKGLIMYHAEEGCTYVYESNNMMAVYRKGVKIREQSLDGMTVFSVEKGYLYYCDDEGILMVYDVRTDELVHQLDVSSLQLANVTTVDGNTYLVGRSGYTLLQDWQLGSTFVYPVQFDAVESCRGRYLTVSSDMELKTYEVSFDKYKMLMSDDIDDELIGYVDFRELYASWYEKGYEVINFYGYLGG